MTGVDLAAVHARYVEALASKPGKGDPPRYVQALEDSVADIRDLILDGSLDHIVQGERL